MKDRISNDLSYVKAGYRSDKWKWVLSLSQVGSLNKNVVGVGEADSSEVDQPAAAAAAAEATAVEVAPKPTTTTTEVAATTTSTSTAATATTTTATSTTTATTTTAAAAAVTTTAPASPSPPPTKTTTLTVAKEVRETQQQKDGAQSEVSTNKPAQRNGTTHHHATLPQVISEEQLTKEHILKTYGMDKWPKYLPCQKKCMINPWCLVDLKAGSGKEKVRPIDQPRDTMTPVGLQNTANTCWINSALQALFHLPKFRNVINSVGGFAGEESLSCMLFLLQAMFVEMETHANKAIACSPGSVFEKMGLYATQEIMCKDADHEVLKCVSEFLENTIDTLVADSRLGPELRPLFSTSLMRIARWKCPGCEREHENQLAPATAYTMAAYVSGDECPLDQCLVDLQTETQTGVSLVCGSEDRAGGGGCGAMVKADRIVTPKIQTLPTILVIRNNSLMDRELKRRLHVVYPETLDLTSHTHNHVAATYTLSAVIFHHGHWVKHFSAHVKTGDKWYNFNDEQVSQLSNRLSTANPSESHRNYFSVANVAQKYKHRPGLRVSRGAFVWIYVNTQSQAAESTPVPPSESVVEYVLLKQNESVNVNHQHQAEMRKEKEALLSQCAVADMSESYTLISEPLLSAWYNDDSLKYTPQPSVLAQALCEHKLFSPLKYNLLKCVRTNGVKELLSHTFGIHEDEALQKLGLPVTLSSESGYCKVCVIKYVNHILFIERVKALHKQAKKESRKDCDGPVTVIGTETLEYWPRLALSAYVKEHGIDVEDGGETENGTDTCKKNEESNKCEVQIGSSDSKINSVSDSSDVCEKDTQTEKGMNVCDTTSIVPDSECKSACESQTEEVESQEKTTPNNKDKEAKEGSGEVMLFNEDIVCGHSLRSPTASACNLPQELAQEIMGLCTDSIHPAIYQKDFDTCQQCGAMLEESVRNCESGRQQKKQLSNLFLDRKRPHPVRDPGKKIYLISRDFYHLWKSYVRSCERGDLVVKPPEHLENTSLLCSHDHLLFPVMILEPHELAEHMVLVWEEEWDTLKELYRPDHIVTAFYSDAGCLMTDPVVCENGCVELRLAKDYEQQFSYEHEIIHVRQVNSANDIPRRLSGRTRGPSNIGASSTLNNENLGPRKKPRLAAGGAGGTASSSQRLVRASRTFSSTDTIREVQNFIAERTGIWPMLQTLWVCGEEQQKGGEAEGGQPLQLTDDHRAMTLNALRVRPGDTIYFRAAVEDMERAAGDGVVEFNEMDDDW